MQKINSYQSPTDEARILAGLFGGVNQATSGVATALLHGNEEDRACASVLLTCLRKVRRWRVPPQWSARDWLEEIAAELILTALHAGKRFDPTRGVPLKAFLYQRVMHRAYARFGCEWRHAMHLASCNELDGIETCDGRQTPFPDDDLELLLDAMEQLSHRDFGLIEALFWGGKTEIELAKHLGISQQAVSKRKKSVIRILRRSIHHTGKYGDK